MIWRMEWRADKLKTERPVRIFRESLGREIAKATTRALAVSRSQTLKCLQGSRGSLNESGARYRQQKVVENTMTERSSS